MTLCTAGIRIAYRLPVRGGVGISKLIPVLAGDRRNEGIILVGCLIVDQPAVVGDAVAVVQPSVIGSRYAGCGCDLHRVTRAVRFCAGSNVYCAAIIARRSPGTRLRFTGGGDNDIGFSAFPCDVQPAVLGRDFYIGSRIIIVVLSHCAFALCAVCGNRLQHDSQVSCFFLCTSYSRVKIDCIAGVRMDIIRRHCNGIHNDLISLCDRFFYIFNIENLIVGAAKENFFSVFHRIDIVLLYLVIGSHIPGNDHFAGIIRLINRKTGRRRRNNGLAGGVLHLTDVDLIIRRFAVDNQTKGRDFLARICGKVNRRGYPLLALGRRIGNVKFYNRIRIVLEDHA